LGRVVWGRGGSVCGIEGMGGLFMNRIGVGVRLDEEQRLKQVFEKVEEDGVEGEKYDFMALYEIEEKRGGGGKVFDDLVDLGGKVLIDGECIGFMGWMWNDGLIKEEEWKDGEKRNEEG
ncbi:hypothetical protein, partial [Bacillus sp. WP8]|uniref:hypothetical protein n=1 Tax=Bacillus sp. WP8 TaxID=756828 RepID=UPI001C92F65F